MQQVNWGMNFRFLRKKVSQAFIFAKYAWNHKKLSNALLRKEGSRIQRI